MTEKSCTTEPAGAERPALRRRRSARVLAPAVAVALLAACGSPAGDSTPAAGGATEERECEVTALAEELADLTGDERAEELRSRAEEAGGTVSLYAELNQEEADPLISLFESTYPGVTVEFYRAGTDDIRARVLQEAQANRTGADLIELDSTEMAQLDGEGVLAPVTTPLSQEVSEAGQFETFVADRFSYIVPSWNPNELAGVPLPESLEDLADPRFKGLLALEGSDVFWFAGLVNYLEEQGMTREEAVDLFKRIAANSAITDGHTTTAELVVAGQYPIAANTFVHRVVSMKKDGAPIEWQPVGIPVVAETTTIGIPCDAPNPAAALLMHDFFLDPELGQELFVELDRTPANAELAQQTLENSDVEPIEVDVATVADEMGTWTELWDEVVRSGTGAAG